MMHHCKTSQWHSIWKYKIKLSERYNISFSGLRTTLSTYSGSQALWIHKSWTTTGACIMVNNCKLIFFFSGILQFYLQITLPPNRLLSAALLKLKCFKYASYARNKKYVHMNDTLVSRDIIVMFNIWKNMMKRSFTVRRFSLDNFVFNSELSM